LRGKRKKKKGFWFVLPLSYQTSTECQERLLF
jgi:hypothetical protein